MRRGWGQTRICATVGSEPADEGRIDRSTVVFGTGRGKTKCLLLCRLTSSLPGLSLCQITMPHAFYQSLWPLSNDKGLWLKVLNRSQEPRMTVSPQYKLAAFPWWFMWLWDLQLFSVICEKQKAATTVQLTFLFVESSSCVWSRERLTALVSFLWVSNWARMEGWTVCTEMSTTNYHICSLIVLQMSGTRWYCRTTENRKESRDVPLFLLLFRNLNIRNNCLYPISMHDFWNMKKETKHILYFCLPYRK